MSNFKQTTTYEDISEAYLYWTRIQEPDYGQNPDKKPIDALDKQEFRYKVVACVSKEVFQEFVKKYPKKKSAPIENDDFLAKMKVDTVPFPNQPMQYVITFKQKVYKNDGQLMPDSLRPRVHQYINGVQTDITQTTLVGNGSKGIVRYSVWTRSENSPPTVSLYAVCVTDLVEYAKPEKPARVDHNSFNLLG